MRRGFLVLMMTAVLEISACGPGESNTPGGPLDADATVRPDLVVPQSSEVQAGRTLTLTFPQETERGIPWVLEQRDGGNWQARYLLISDGNNTAPTWAGPAERGQWAWEDIGVEGPGPDTVLIPDGAPPGTYRLCTANAVNNFCAEIEIVD